MSDSVSSVRCRPHASGWGVVAVFGVFGVLPFTLLLPSQQRHAPAETPFLVAGLVSFFLIPTLLYGFWLARAAVIADESGVSWRGMGGWRQAPWNAVTDYHYRLRYQNKRLVEKPFVVTPVGTIRFALDWTNVPEFCQMVQERATNTPVRKWALQGTRPKQDWPLTFDYALRGDMRFVLVLGVITLFLPLGMLPRMLPKVPEWWRLLGPGWTVAMLLTSLCAFLLPAFLIYLMHGPRVREARRRRAERITVDRIGVTFSEGQAERRVAWEEIADFYAVSGAGKSRSPVLATYVIVPRTGQPLEFVNVINDLPLLERIIAQHAAGSNRPADALPGKWRSGEPDKDVLGGEGARWSSGREGVGARVFHYRNRTNRAGLLMFTMMAVAPLLPLALARTGLTDAKGDPYTLGIFLGPFGLALLWGWWLYYTARIELDEDGITQYRLNGRRRILWADVRDYRWVGEDIFRFGQIEATDGTRVGFWLGVSEGEKLCQQIAERAPQPQTGWEASQKGKRGKAAAK